MPRNKSRAFLKLLAIVMTIRSSLSIELFQTTNDQMNATETEYNVFCRSCDSVWTPTPQSRLWWKAKKRAEEGFLDALCVSGEECGCEKKVVKPDAPIRVFGYDFECHNFNIPFTSFTAAVSKFQQLKRDGYEVFITGVSDSVCHHLEFGF